MIEAVHVVNACNSTYWFFSDARECLHLSSLLESSCWALKVDNTGDDSDGFYTGDFRRSVFKVKVEKGSRYEVLSKSGFLISFGFGPTELEFHCPGGEQ